MALELLVLGLELLHSLLEHCVVLLLGRGFLFSLLLSYVVQALHQLVPGVLQHVSDLAHLVLVGEVLRKCQQGLDDGRQLVVLVHALLNELDRLVELSLLAQRDVAVQERADELQRLVNGADGCLVLAH